MMDFRILDVEGVDFRGEVGALPPHVLGTIDEGWKSKVYDTSGW